MTTRICFIRHGETDWNVEHRIQGQVNAPLNHTGHQQAISMAEHAAQTQFDAIYSSDLQRAFVTANVLAQKQNLTVHPMPQLRERHFGILQGLTSKGKDDHKQPQAFALYKARDIHCNFETGESMLTFAARVAEAVEIITQHHPNQTVVAVTHAGILDILYRKTTGRPLHTPRDFDVPNCALNWFRFDAQGWHLETWGELHNKGNTIKDAAE